MKTLKSILESVTVTPTKVKETSSYTEIWWQDLGVKLKKTNQKPLVDGYITMIGRSFWDDYDKKKEIKRWENPPYIFDEFSAYIKQFGNDEPVMSITLAGSDLKDRYSSFRSVISYIKVPNPDKKSFTADELIEFGEAVIDKLNSKTAKVVKYMANNWDLPNEYTDYTEFLKL